jgi:hypothetical protein
LVHSSLPSELIGFSDIVLSLPDRLFFSINKNAIDLNSNLEKQTEKYLQRVAEQERKLQRELSKIDSNAAKRIFAGSE